MHYGGWTKDARHLASQTTRGSLELLFDLTFAASFGLAASQVASVLAEGHFIAGLVGFGFASFAICWAWINFSWLRQSLAVLDCAAIRLAVRGPGLELSAAGYVRAPGRSRPERTARSPRCSEAPGVIRSRLQ
jgi:hypothetical protein